MGNSNRTTRMASVIAATAVALASGTNYAFSAWGPEFGKQLKLSATQTNIIGVAGNMGMYATGIPTGFLVDKKGPRWGVAVGTVSLAVGYFPLHSAFELGPGAVGLPLLAFCSFLTGFGSCSSFSAAIKTATVNWPENRGTATAFPLAGFGLSAFFFATIATVAFGHNISDFLMMLSIGTLCLNVGSLPFMTLVPDDDMAYASLPTDERLPDPARSRSPSKTRRKRTVSMLNAYREAGKQYTEPQVPKSSHSARDDPEVADQTASSSEASSLNRKVAEEDEDDDSEPSTPRPISRQSTGCSQDAEITGFKVLARLDFWQLFAILALLAGVGLMTINNIGNVVKALIRRWDRLATSEDMQRAEQLHVSILSLGSFAGRLLSGIGSDFLVKKLQASRFWCLVGSSFVFVAAQICGLTIVNPNLIFLLSSLSGLGYGALFGVFPALVADTFGTRALSFNWGLVILAPVISGNIFNLYYGSVYDDHSHVINDGSMDCPDGLSCYDLAYRVTLISSIVGAGLALWCIWYRKQTKTRGRAVSHSLLRS